MELFQSKISNDGKLLEGVIGRISLVDEQKGLVRTVREINETDDGSSQSQTSTNVKSYTPSINNFASPRNVGYSSSTSTQGSYGDSFTNKATLQQPSDDRLKSGLTKKPQGTVDEG